MTLILKPPSRFESGSPISGIQCLNHQDNWEDKTYVTVNVQLLQTLNKLCIIRQHGEAFIFYALLPISLLAKVFQWLFLTGFFFHLGDKKVIAGRVQVIILHSNNCREIGLGGLSLGRLRRMVVLQRWLYQQV